MISLNVQKTPSTNAVTTDLVIGSGRTLSPTGTGVIQATSVLYGTGITETAGTGSPESVVTANIGSVFHRTNGSTGTTLYIKESGTGNTGWVAVSPGGGSGDMLLGTAQTVTAAKTYNAGTLKIASGGDLVDANANELFKFTATTSAVNEFTITNAATGNAPSLTATGGDTDVGILIRPKGTGVTTFRSGVGANGDFTFDTDPTGTSLNQVKIKAQGTQGLVLGTSTTAGGIITGSVSGDGLIMSGGNILISSDGGATVSGKFVTSTGQFALPKNITSTSTTTGTLVVTGGVGISGALFIGGAITTGTPSGGTAGAWKLGILVTAAVTPDATRYIQLDVAGTLYKVIIST